MTQKCLKIILILAKRALFKQILQKLVSDYWMLIYSRIFLVSKRFGLIFQGLINDTYSDEHVCNKDFCMLEIICM